MADATVVDKFDKATVKREEVEKIRIDKLTNAGAKSSVLTEDSTHWILTTVFPGC